MIKTILIIIGILILIHFICGAICILFYLDKSIRMHIDIGDFILMFLFGPLLVLIFGFMYLMYGIDILFEKIKDKIYERKTKI